MRRLLAALLSFVAAVAGASILAVAGPARAQLPPDDPRLGLVYDGLRKAPVQSLCGGAFESVLDTRLSPSMKQVLCTHGPDPAPEGVDVREDRGPDPAAELAPPSAGTPAEGGAVPCYGNGTDGMRVQLLYARSSTGADRFATYAASFRSWATRLDQVVAASAAETGGTRHVRFVTDAACNPVVERVALSAGAMSRFSTMVSELHSRGYARSDRKYLVWADSNVYCGIGELYVDDSQDPTPGRNYNNGNPWIQGAIGRVDNGCWGLPNLTEAHELLHLLGGVQTSAPHATPGFHCLDESDRLCYSDGSTSSPLRYLCPSQHEALYDCNHDDYFHTAPPPGSYLSTHWNIANSGFLGGSAPNQPPPPLPTTTTSTTSPPPTTTSSTTAPPTTLPPTTTTTTASATTTTTTTRPPIGSPPSAPRSLSAGQPGVGTGVVLSWQPPTNGPVTGYRIYRGPSPYSQTLLTTVTNGLGYNDATAGGSLHFYRVTAYNGAGEGPSSNLTGMIGKTTTSAGMVNEVDPRLVISSTQLRSAWTWRWA